MKKIKDLHGYLIPFFGRSDLHFVFNLKSYQTRDVPFFGLVNIKLFEAAKRVALNSRFIKFMNVHKNK